MQNGKSKLRLRRHFPFNLIKITNNDRYWDISSQQVIQHLFIKAPLFRCGSSMMIMDSCICSANSLVSFLCRMRRGSPAPFLSGNWWIVQGNKGNWSTVLLWGHALFFELAFYQFGDFFLGFLVNVATEGFPVCHSGGGFPVFVSNLRPRAINARRHFFGLISMISSTVPPSTPTQSALN